MKRKVLIKKLAVTGGLWFAGIGLAFAGNFFLQDDIESLQQETTSAKQQYEANKTEQINIEKSIQDSEIANKFYTDYTASKESRTDSFRRNFLIEALSEVKNRVNANEISFVMTPFEPDKTITSTQNVEVVTSVVSIKYSALTDVMAYKILNLIPQKLPGAVYYKKFTIEKKADIDSNTLLSISEGRPPSLVEGEIDFEWISIRVAKDKKKDETTTTEGGGNV